MGRRCLIVDDSDAFLKSAGALLQSQGVEVVGYAKSTEDAVRAALSLEPDVVLVDVKLGDEDGIALARRLSGELPTAVIVLISSFEFDDVAELVAGSKADGFLSKTALSAATLDQFSTSWRQDR
jgi:two-component system nitrate/nitrite response regulator NarL